jgi:Flp pilus assembly protein TadG
MKSQGSRRGSQGGSQMMELGLALIPFFAILFLLMDLCLVVFLKSTFQHAVREGVRYAVTRSNFDGMTSEESVRAVVRYFALNTIRAADATSKIQIRYFKRDTLVEVYQNDPGNIVEVSVENYSWVPLAPLFRSGAPVRISARSADLIE